MAPLPPMPGARENFSGTPNAPSEIFSNFHSVNTKNRVTDRVNPSKGIYAK